MRTYLKYLLCVSDKIVQTSGSRCVYVQEESLLIIKYFIEFYKSGIKTLCKYVCNTGGKIASADKSAAMIPNLIYIILAISEKFLKSSMCTSNTYNIFNRRITHESISMTSLRLFGQHSQLNGEH